MANQRGPLAPKALRDLVGQATFDRVVEIDRVATDKTPNVATMLLGACARACFALGFRRVVSYTLLGELGSSYRAAGWHPVALTRGDREWSCPSRPRKSVAQRASKIRWETGPEALVLGMAEVEKIEVMLREAYEREKECPRILSRRATSVVG